MLRPEETGNNESRTGFLEHPIGSTGSQGLQMLCGAARAPLQSILVRGMFPSLGASTDDRHQGPLEAHVLWGPLPFPPYHFPYLSNIQNGISSGFGHDPHLQHVLKACIGACLLYLQVKGQLAK